MVNDSSVIEAPARGCPCGKDCCDNFKPLRGGYLDDDNRTCPYHDRDRTCGDYGCQWVVECANCGAWCGCNI